MKKIVLVCVLGMFVTYTNAHSGGTNKQRGGPTCLNN